MTMPSVIVFDVNETLSDMSPLAARFADVGAPEHAARLWFATLLRDGFALAAAGAMEPFAAIGDGALRVVLNGVPLDRDPDAAAAHIMGGFQGLGVHPDVLDGVPALHETGARLITLSNGSAQVAERLLSAAGVRDRFERLLSVEDAGAWKPARASYEYAARVCAVEPGDMLLVAAHPWDIDGAARAGMRTAWVNRGRAPYPGHFRRPDHTVDALTELRARLAQ